MTVEFNYEQEAPHAITGAYYSLKVYQSDNEKWLTITVRTRVYNQPTEEIQKITMPFELSRKLLIILQKIHY
jgi:hypothetical protein